MSKYNTYAQQLDAAFKTARDEYAEAYSSLEQARQADTDAKAWRPNDNEEDKRLRIATAGLELKRRMRRSRSQSLESGRSLTRSAKNCVENSKRTFRKTASRTRTRSTRTHWSF